MKMREILIIAGFVAAFSVLVPTGFVWGADPPPSTGTIQGPELWGVVVIDCSSGGSATGTLRVKRVVDCTVQTQAELATGLTCPASASDPLWYQFTGITLFGLTGTPIVTKVKNFNLVPNVICSFDVQIKFWVP